MGDIPVLELKNINKSYRDNTNLVSILKDSSLKLFRGEFVSLVGDSGCGKTTFLQICGLLDSIDSGEIYINNSRVDNISDYKKTLVRRKQIGFVYQMHHLFPEFNVYENIAISMKIDNKKQYKENIEELLEELDIKDKIYSMPSQLSGGERQRVAIARAIIKKPQIVLADEPTGNLDENNSNIVMSMFLNICKKYNSSLIMVSHNLNLAKMTDRIITIKDKKVIEYIDK